MSVLRWKNTLKYINFISLSCLCCCCRHRRRYHHLFSYFCFKVIELVLILVIELFLPSTSIYIILCCCCLYYFATFIEFYFLQNKNVYKHYGVIKFSGLFCFVFLLGFMSLRFSLYSENS